MKLGGTAREPDTEFAWLIERGQPEGQAPTVWLDTSTQRPDWYGDWTQDANQATKFPTRESAEWHIRDARIPSARAVEHGWFGRGPDEGGEA